MIKVTRQVTREMGERDYRTRKPFVLQLEKGGLLVRIKPKGARTWYTVTVKQIYMMGAANRAAQIKAERKEARERKKKERQGL